ncbi:MAG: hypothetical protein R3Y10_07060 [Ferrimonas sp.]
MQKACKLVTLPDKKALTLHRKKFPAKYERVVSHATSITRYYGDVPSLAWPELVIKANPFLGPWIFIARIDDEYIVCFGEDNQAEGFDTPPADRIQERYQVLLQTASVFVVDECIALPNVNVLEGNLPAPDQKAALKIVHRTRPQVVMAGAIIGAAILYFNWPKPPPPPVVVISPEEIWVDWQKQSQLANDGFNYLSQAYAQLQTTLPPNWGFSSIAVQGGQLVVQLAPTDKALQQPIIDWEAGLASGWSRSGTTFYYGFEPNREVPPTFIVPNAAPQIMDLLLLNGARLGATHEMPGFASRSETQVTFDGVNVSDLTKLAGLFPPWVYAKDIVLQAAGNGFSLTATIIVATKDD